MRITLSLPSLGRILARIIGAPPLWRTRRPLTISDVEIESGDEFGGCAQMNLHGLVEMIRKNREGASDWPVLFACYSQLQEGEWQEQDANAREAITTIVVDAQSKEVLLVMDHGSHASTTDSVMP